MSLPVAGQSLRIRLQEQSREYYRSRVQEVSTTHLLITAPIHISTSEPARPVPNQFFWIEYSARDGSLCYFKSQLLRQELDKQTFWVVSRPNVADIHKQQRREYVRVTADIAVQVQREAGNSAAVPVHTLHTMDISGGGMALLVPAALKLGAGTHIQLKFSLPHVNVAIQTRAMVIRVSEPNERGFSVASVQFVGLREGLRQKIIQYTFWRQRYAASVQS